MRYDLISLGEPLLRLSPPGFGQLRTARSFNVFVVGSQLNVAADLAGLGARTAFLAKLPDNPLGRLALHSIEGYGVDASHIKMIPGGKMGVTYVEFSTAPRAPLAVYDRAGSAASTTAPGDFDWDELLGQTRYAYTDGIFPGLSPTCSEAAVEFVGAAKRKGCTVCFDVNYREHLWTPGAARETWGRILPNVDILATNRNVSELVFGYDDPKEEDLMRRYAGEFGCAIVCMTSREMQGLSHGAWSSVALSADRVIAGARQEFDIVDRYGTGDAWFAGFIYGHQMRDVQYGLDFGNALCALAHTVEGDVIHTAPSDVEAIIGGQADLGVKR